MLDATFIIGQTVFVTAPPQPYPAIVREGPVPHAPRAYIVQSLLDNLHYAEEAQHIIPRPTACDRIRIREVLVNGLPLPADHPAHPGPSADPVACWRNGWTVTAHPDLTVTLAIYWGDTHRRTP
jgi:hypothetical protein